MRHQARPTDLRRTTALTAGVVVVLLLGLPAAGSFAAWNDSAPVGGATTTGSLGVDQETLAGGTWTEDGDTFDPATDRLSPGATLVHTVTGVPVTAVGDNLEATFQGVEGAVVPGALTDHVALTVASDPTPIAGADSDADGKQAVDLTLTVAADADLPAGEEIIDLSGLTVTLTNGRGWSDVAGLDAGVLTTAGGTVAGGTVNLSYDLARDDDGVVGFYLDDPLPGTTVRWNLWNWDGTEVVTDAVDGLNSMDYTGTGATPYVEITGGFRGFGSPDQTQDVIGALVYVSGMDDDLGMTSASHAFKDAVWLTGVSGLPSTLTDTSYAFQNAGSATGTDGNIQLWDWDSSRVTTMAHMFEGATNFRQPDIQWDTSSVTDMSYMFAGATSFVGPTRFTSTSAVTTMEGMFAGATSFVDAPWVGGSAIDQWDLSNVTSTARMFEGATSFNADVGSWDVSNVSAMQAMFRGATAFSQDLSGWDVSNVANHEAFADGSGLTADQLPLWDGAAPAGRAAPDEPADLDEPVAPDRTARASDGEASGEGLAPPADDGGSEGADTGSGTEGSDTDTGSDTGVETCDEETSEADATAAAPTPVPTPVPTDSSTACPTAAREDDEAD